MKESMPSMKDLLMGCRKQDSRRGTFQSKWGQSGSSSSIMLEDDDITGNEWKNEEKSSQRHDSGSREGIKLVVATKRRC